MYKLNVPKKKKKRNKGNRAWNTFNVKKKRGYSYRNKLRNFFKIQVLRMQVNLWQTRLVQQFQFNKTAAF